MTTQEELIDLQAKIENAKDIIADALYNDAAHHKQWYLWHLRASIEQHHRIC